MPPFIWERYLFIDFAVGAYKSDEVLLLRARPIVEVRVYSRIDPDPVPLTSTGTSCGSRGLQGSTNPCFTASLCFDFTGEGTNKTCMYYREIVFFLTKKWFIFNLTSFKKSQMKCLKNNIHKHFIDNYCLCHIIIIYNKNYQILYYSTVENTINPQSHPTLLQRLDCQQITHHIFF